MAEAALGLLVLLALGAAVVAARGVLDGRRTGTPASIAVLAPLLEGARLLRSRAVGARPGPVPAVAGALLLLAPLLRVLALPLPGSVLAGTAPGPAWFLVADLVWWIGAALLIGRRVLPAALALEAPLVLAIVAPAVAVHVEAGEASRGLPGAVEAPVAFLLVLVGGGVLLPWAVQPAVERRGGAARLLAGAGLAMQPVAAAATASLLLVGDRPGPLVVAAVVLTGLLVVGARRFPVPSLPRLARLAAAVLLPLAAVQLAIVVALTLLA